MGALFSTNSDHLQIFGRNTFERHLYTRAGCQQAIDISEFQCICFVFVTDGSLSAVTQQINQSLARLGSFERLPRPTATTSTTRMVLGLA